MGDKYNIFRGKIGKYCGFLFTKLGIRIIFRDFKGMRGMIYMVFLFNLLGWLLQKLKVLENDS